MYESFDKPSEVISDHELKNAKELANEALPNPQPDVNGRMQSWERDAIGLHTSFHLVEKVMGEDTYLLGVKVINRTNNPDLDVTLYMLNADAGKFIVIQGDQDTYDIVTRTKERDDVSRNTDALLFQMGEYYPKENDWADFLLLLQDGKAYAMSLKQELNRQLGAVADTTRHISITDIET